MVERYLLFLCEKILRRTKIKGCKAANISQIYHLGAIAMGPSGEEIQGMFASNLILDLDYCTQDNFLRSF